MERSTFAGLTRLDPGDPLNIDGGSFKGRNIDTVDQWLSQIPAHRHNGAAPLANPTAGPNVTTHTTGGQIPGSTTVVVGYTLLDAGGGETTISPLVSVTTQSPIGTPAALASATLSNASGILMANTYQYAFTLTDGAGGESDLTPALTVDVLPGFASSQVLFTGLSSMIAASPGATGWRLYKSVGGSQYDLLTFGNGNTFKDDGTVAVIYGVQPATSDTTLQTASLTVTVPGIETSAAVGGFKLYISQNTSFFDPCLFGQYPQASGGMPITVGALAVTEGSPPPVSTAVRGATPVDATTDLINLPEELSILGYAPGSGASGGLIVADGTTTVLDVIRIDLIGASVTNEGAGHARISVTASGGSGGGSGGVAMGAYTIAPDQSALPNTFGITREGTFISLTQWAAVADNMVWPPYPYASGIIIGLDSCFTVYGLPAGTGTLEVDVMVFNATGTNILQIFSDSGHNAWTSDGDLDAAEPTVIDFTAANVQAIAGSDLQYDPVAKTILTKGASGPYAIMLNAQIGI